MKLGIRNLQLGTELATDELVAGSYFPISIATERSNQ